MTKDNMDVISITPGATVKVEHFKFGTVGSLEYNAQQEFDYRREALHTPQVVNKPISSDADWGLTGWTPGDSLEVTTSAGDLLCNQGIADIGGRRYIRTGSGSIKAEVGDPADATYFIRIKYVVSTDTHSFIAEAAESAETNDNKYLTLAQATWTDPNWTAEVDLRSSNTSLSPPVTFSGDTDASVAPVLTVTQTGSTEQSLEVYGGDIQLFTSGSPFKQVIYGNSTDAIEIHNAAVASGKLRAGTVADTLYVDNFDIATQLDVASLTFSTTIIANATEIGDLSTITLATTGASITFVNASDQDVAFTNSGAGNANITTDGKITASATGSNIAGSATIGGVVMNGNDVTADKITLSDTTNQVYLNSAGASDGIITTASLSGGDKTYTLPNTTGTFAVTGTGGMSVNSSGQVVHSTAAGYKHVPGGGATTAVLMGDGSDGSVWDSTPSFSTLTATSSGSSIASSASVGGVTMNIGAISGVSTINASGVITGGTLTSNSEVYCNNLRTTTTEMSHWTSDGQKAKLTGSAWKPAVDHDLDLGETTVAWDVVYRQSEVTTSFVGTFDDPIEIVKMAAWQPNGHLIHTTLPESIRTLRLNTEEEASQITGRLTGKKVIKGNAPERFEFISDIHYDTDGMDMLLLQTLQKLIEKVEILESRVDTL